MVLATASGVAGWGVGSLKRSPISSPVSRSTMPPLTPLPPTSMPNPRRCGPPLVLGWAAGESVAVIALLTEAGRCDALHTLVARETSWVAVAQPVSDRTLACNGSVLRWNRDGKRRRSGPVALGGGAAGDGGGRFCPAAAGRGIRRPPTKRRGSGAGKEHTDRPRHGRRHRNRAAAARPAGRTEAG